MNANFLTSADINFNGYYAEYNNASIIYTISFHLLSYQVVVLKGTDVDNPGNLDKFVTVE